LAAYAGRLNTDITAAEVNRNVANTWRWVSGDHDFRLFDSGPDEDGASERPQERHQVEAVMIGDSCPR